MTTHLRSLSTAVALAGWCGAAGFTRAADPFAWLSADVSVSAEDRRRMHDREVVSETLDADGDGLGLFLASTVTFDTTHFTGVVHRTDELWKHDGIPQVAAFSPEPRLEDLAMLSLDEDDLEALADCEPGDCDVKLSAPEIEMMRAALDEATPPERPAAGNTMFRRFVLARARHYLAQGFHGLPPYADHDESVSPQESYGRVAARLAALTREHPQLAAYLQDYPHRALPGALSRLFWLRTTYTPRPTVQIIHLVMLPLESGAAGRPDVVVAWRQVYASHYINAWLSLSALIPSDADGRTYLAYINRSEVDGLGGWLAPIKRFFVERRVRSTAETLFELQRRRLETWEAVP